MAVAIRSSYVGAAAAKTAVAEVRDRMQKTIDPNLMQYMKDSLQMFANFLPPDELLHEMDVFSFEYMVLAHFESSVDGIYYR